AAIMTDIPENKRKYHMPVTTISTIPISNGAAAPITCSTTFGGDGGWPGWIANIPGGLGVMRGWPSARCKVKRVAPAAEGSPDSQRNSGWSTGVTTVPFEESRMSNSCADNHGSRTWALEPLRPTGSRRRDSGKILPESGPAVATKASCGAGWYRGTDPAGFATSWPTLSAQR